MNNRPSVVPSVVLCIEGFYVTSSQLCWWTKTKDLSLDSFVRPPEVVYFSNVIGASRSWLKTSYCICIIRYMEITGTKPYIPKGFELGTTLS